MSRAAAIGQALRRGGARAPALRMPRLRTLLALLVLAVLVLAGWFWLRDSSLVAVRTVEVSGIGGVQGQRVRAVLEEAARSMTTLHVRDAALDAAVAPFSLVRGVEVSTSFPHTMRIHVVTNVAVGVVLAEGRRIPVTSDGTLLRDVIAHGGLPTIALRSPPGGRRLSGGKPLAAVAALAAAPSALRVHVATVGTTRAHGLTIQLAHGPALWFGDDARLAAKWAAAAAVLADPAAAGARSIDVSTPERPAVGGLPGGVAAGGQSDVPTPPPGATTTPGAPAPGATTTPGPTGG